MAEKMKVFGVRFICISIVLSLSRGKDFRTSYFMNKQRDRNGGEMSAMLRTFAPKMFPRTDFC